MASDHKGFLGNMAERFARRRGGAPSTPVRPRSAPDPARPPAPPKPPANTDVRSFYPELEPVYRALADADWSRLRKLLGEFHGNDRLRAGMVVSDSEGSEHMLQEALSGDAGDLDARALLGNRTVKLGWTIRGNGLANTVSRGQFDAFHDHVRRADAMFTEVTAQDPTNVHAAYGRVTATRALSMGRNETRRRYEQIARYEPHLWDVQWQVLQGLLPKWGGTWEESWEFVTRCAEQAPPGSPNAALIADYQYEKRASLESEERDSYSQHESVRADLVRAAASSILHPDFRRGPGWLSAYSQFALGFAFAGEWSTAADLFKVIDNRVATLPWGNWADPEDIFKFWRDRCYSRAGVPQ